jgi:DNA (cytosine-5)-methyltransferase 1
MTHLAQQGTLFPSDILSKVPFARQRNEHYFAHSPLEIGRIITTRDGHAIESRIPTALPDIGSDENQLAEAFDASWLRLSVRPFSAGQRGTVRVVDLFCGAGGMSVGLEEAGRALDLKVDHVFASDIQGDALETYTRNFRPQISESRPIEQLLDSNLGDSLSPSERSFQRLVGPIDLVVGGPPCQGHSDLNNHTRRQDPKNDLYDRMARFAEVVGPSHVVIENVPGVRHDVGGVFERTIGRLTKLGYRVDSFKFPIEKLGVPQRRHRAVVVASLSAPVHSGFLEQAIEEYRRPPRSVRWAIEDLIEVGGEHPIDQVTQVSKTSQERIDWLFDNDEFDLPDWFRPDCHRTKVHTYKSVYGRLYWELPAWTITTGFQVMGQGRFLHPTQRRVITSHEAARLQYFPDFFDFGIRNRKGYAKMIGNAVPSKLAYVVALELLR